MPSQAEVTTVALAEASRRAQLRIRREAVTEVARSWQVLDFDRLTRTWPLWLDGIMEALVRHHAVSSDQGALFYRAVRQYELGEPSVAALAAPPTEEWLAKALGYAAAGVYAKALRRGVEPSQASRTALTKTLGVASRIVLDGGRTTVADSMHADKRAIRYMRITDADPCAFCALVAARGAVYRSEASAGSVVGRGTEKKYDGTQMDARRLGIRPRGSRQLGEMWHDDCGCTVVPVFRDNYTISGPAADAQDLYYEHIAHLPNKERMSAFRKAWAARAA